MTRSFPRAGAGLGTLARMALITVLVNAAAASPNAADRAVFVLAIGDSLTAGYGLPLAEAFPARLESYLRERGWNVRVENAGVSGDTSAGGRARLGWVLASETGGAPDVAVVELGANDALRGLDPEAMEENLEAILTALERRGAAVLLTGMRAPRNLGEEYVGRFEAVFPRLAERHGVPLYPFFLEGVAGRPELNQDDGLHPNARGVEEIVRRIGPRVEALVEEVVARRESGSAETAETGQP